MPETHTEREIMRNKNDTYTVQTFHEQVFDEEEFENLLDNVRSQVQQKEEEIEEREDLIEQLAEDEGGGLHKLHSAIKGEPQEDDVEANSVQKSDVNKYLQLRQTNDELEQLRNQLEELKEDLEELEAV
jgi:DNA repair exonuclease SbcCD ATPase subunit